MIGYCELCKRLGDLGECQMCGKRACGSCMRAVDGKKYCVSCMKKAAKEDPKAVEKRQNVFAVFLLLVMLGSFAIVYPKYREIEGRSKYTDFYGFVPVEHNRTSDSLIIVFENQINQPVSLASVRSTGNCTFDGGRVGPEKRLIVSCDNASATRVYLNYAVGGVSVSTSGRIPPEN